MNKEVKESIVIYEAENGQIELQADIERDTIWARELQIADLFATTHQNINLHMKNVYQDGELIKAATCKESLQVRKEGGRAVKRPIIYYNLDAIIAVGYRVNSKKATQFRIWATRILRNYVVKGFSLNKRRLESKPTSLVGLYEAVTLLESLNKEGTLKGKITLKLTENLIPTRSKSDDL